MKRTLAVILLLSVIPTMSFGDNCRDTDDPLACMIDKYCETNDLKNDIDACVSLNVRRMRGFLALSRVDACVYLGNQLNRESDTEEIATLLDTMKEHCAGKGTTWHGWGVSW